MRPGAPGESATTEMERRAGIGGDRRLAFDARRVGERSPPASAPIRRGGHRCDLSTSDRPKSLNSYYVQWFAQSNERDEKT
jgi:hypothetical protein